MRFLISFLLLVSISNYGFGISNIKHTLNKVRISSSSVLAKIGDRAQQMVAGGLLVCSTVGLLSCSVLVPVIQKTGRKAPVQEDISTSYEWRTSSHGGRYAVDRSSGEIVGVDENTLRLGRHKKEELNRLFKKFLGMIDQLHNTSAYDPKWNLRHDEASDLHVELQLWYATHAENPIDYGFAPSAITELASKLEEWGQILEGLSENRGITFGGVPLDGFDNFGWVFKTREWPPQFGFSENDVVLGISGLDANRFNSLKGQVYISDYEGVLIHYYVDERSHIGQVLSTDSEAGLLTVTSVYGNWNDQVITEDQIGGVYVADDYRHPSHKLAGRFIDIPENSIVQVFSNDKKITVQEGKAFAKIVFSDAYLLALLKSEDGWSTYALLKYNPAMKFSYPF